MLQAGGASKNRGWAIANVIIGAICFALISCTTVVYASRSFTAYRLGKRWCNCCTLNINCNNANILVNFLVAPNLMPFRPSSASSSCSIACILVICVIMMAHHTFLIIAWYMACRTRRRRKFVTLMLTELVAQWINVAFFILPNATLLARPCDFFTKLVREASLWAPTYEDVAMSQA